MSCKTVLGLILAVGLLSNLEALVEDKPQVGRPVVRFPAEGGSEGTAFDDLDKIGSDVFNIHSIAISSGDQVDSIQVTYLLKSGSLHKAPKRGRGSGRLYTITLAADEYVSKVEGSTNGVLINQLTITTKKQLETRVYGPFGKVAGHTNLTLTQGVILGFQGTASDHLNSIGVYCLAPTKESNDFGWYGIGFREDPDEFPPVVKISKILVHHRDVVDSVQFQYLLHGGGKRMGDKHGGDGGNLTTIRLSSDEELVGAEGLLNGGIFSDLQQITFVSRKKSSPEVTLYHGPFGILGDTPFSMKGNIIAFAGASVQDALQTVAFYYY